MNMMVRRNGLFACPDWWSRLQAGQTLVPDLPVDEIKARKAVTMFNALRLPDVRGRPLLRDAGGQWFRDIVRAVFGARDPVNGRDLVREVFCLVPKKSAKTTYSAALGVVALVLCDIPNAQMLILGPTQNISSRCFDQAAGMIAAHPQLQKLLHVQHHIKEITNISTGAVLAVKTFDMNVVTGEIPVLTIIDELHLVAAKSYAQRVVAQITGGMITNDEAKLVYITTQSDVPPMGVFKEKLDYARGVRDGAITEGVSLLPVMYEFPPEVQTDESCPWRNPEMWPAVLPNWGLSIIPDLLIEKYAQAVAEGAEAERIWASQHLNIQIGLGLHGDRWEGAPVWMAAAHEPDDELPGLTLDDMLDAVEVAVAGIDGGGLDDLAAFTVMGRLPVSKRWVIWTHAWAQPEVFEKRKSIASTLRDFERQGDLTVCDAPDQDFAEMVELALRLRDSGLLPEKSAFGLDAYGVAGLTDMMVAAGIAPEQMVAIGQGWKMQTAVKTLPRNLRYGKAVHLNQPLLNWAVGNAKAELRGSNTLITKAASGVAKIDPLMATFNATQLMVLNPVAHRRPQTRIRAL